MSGEESQVQSQSVNDPNSQDAAFIEAQDQDEEVQDIECGLLWECLFCLPYFKHATLEHQGEI